MKNSNAKIKKYANSEKPTLLKLSTIITSITEDSKKISCQFKISKFVLGPRPINSIYNHASLLEPGCVMKNLNSLKKQIQVHFVILANMQGDEIKLSMKSG